MPPVPPRPEDADAIERGRRLFAQPCTFVMGALRLDQVPEPRLAEVAFAGRSNVGKSSLVNALTGRKTLARTSNTPGRTQQLNFFELGGALMLADLPGYGFAQAPKGTVEQWTRLVMAYLRGRPPLRRVMLLIDARHGLKKADLEVMTMLDKTAVSYQIVLTKCDKAATGPREAVRDAIMREIPSHTAAHPVVLATSAVTGEGIAEARAELAALAERWS